jgi:SAM-dependent methyltransferase
MVQRMIGRQQWSSVRPTRYIFSPEWLVLRENQRNVASALDRFTSGRLLDLGCGSKPFERRGQGIEWVGFDVEDNPYADVHGNATELPFPAESFDCVLATQVLEHVDDPAGMLCECARVLRPKGLLILSAPQYWELHEEPHDYFRFTEYGLRLLCRRAGLTVVDVYREACGIAVAGLAVNTAINHVGGLPNSIVLKALKAPLYLLVNVVCFLLARILPNPRDVQNYTLIAAAGETVNTSKPQQELMRN